MHAACLHLYSRQSLLYSYTLLRQLNESRLKGCPHFRDNFVHIPIYLAGTIVSGLIREDSSL